MFTHKQPYSGVMSMRGYVQRGNVLRGFVCEGLCPWGFISYTRAIITVNGEM